MTALLILLVGILLAAAYGWLLNKASGELLMSLSVLVFIPWVIIAIGTIIALVVLT